MSTAQWKSDRREAHRRTRLAGTLRRAGPRLLGGVAVLIAVVIVLVPAVEIGRGWEAQRLAAEHGVRDKMLDAAGMIADGIHRERETIAAYVLAPVMGSIVRPDGSRLRLDDFARRSTEIMGALDSHPDTLRGYFRFALNEGWPKGTVVAAVGGANRPRVRDAILAAVARNHDEIMGARASMWINISDVDGQRVSFAFARERALDGTPLAIFGFTYARAEFERRMVRGVLGGVPLLTRTFNGLDWRTGRREQPSASAGPLRSAPRAADVRLNELLLVEVLGFGNETIYRTDSPAARWDSPYAGEFSLATPEPLLVRVTLPREYGDRLVQEASDPTAQRWLLAGVTLLAGVFVIAVVVEVRRQRQLAEARRGFISSVSHELRTPLAHMAALSETLLVGGAESPEQERRWLGAIHRESHRLGRMVENVLLHARGEAGAMPLDLTWTNLTELVDDIVASADAVARARGVRVVASVPPVCRAHVDIGAMRQILLNLVENAIKYGPEGQTVTVRITVVPPAGRESTALRLTVDDQGPGVPIEDRTRVWAAFERAGSRQSATGGSGLGLSVVLDLVVAHDGRAWVTDAPDGGARFVVELPQPVQA